MISSRSNLLFRCLRSLEHDQVETLTVLLDRATPRPQGYPPFYESKPAADVRALIAGLSAEDRIVLLVKLATELNKSLFGQVCARENEAAQSRESSFQ